jgi:hypothetical protein
MAQKGAQLDPKILFNTLIGTLDNSRKQRSPPQPFLQFET